MRLASGRQIREASSAEVREILTDRPAISITSGSSVIMNPSALRKLSHNSVNLFHLQP